MPLLGTIDATRVREMVEAKVEVAFHVTLKDPVLLLDYYPRHKLFEIYRGAALIWNGRDLDEAVAIYNREAGFVPEDFSDIV